MASDLPDFRFEDSTDMARTLVTYMSDARAIRSAIRQEFQQGPTLGTIERMRAAYLATQQKPHEAPFKIHEGYYPADASQKAAATSKRFLDAIEKERALSVKLAEINGALNSTLLTRPDLVDKRWDRETEQAWLQNRELRL